MDNKQLVVIVVIAVLVSLITALVAVKFTGNAVRVPTQVFGSGYVDTYTKQEVDRLLASSGGFNTNSSFNFLSLIFEHAKSTGQITMGSTSFNGVPVTFLNGKIACGATKTCIVGYGGGVYANQRYFDQDVNGLFSCSDNLNLTDIQKHPDFVEGLRIRVQYLCIENDIVSYFDSLKPTTPRPIPPRTATGSGSVPFKNQPSFMDRITL